MEEIRKIAEDLAREITAQQGDSILRMFPIDQRIELFKLAIGMKQLSFTEENISYSLGKMDNMIEMLTGEDDPGDEIDHED